MANNPNCVLEGNQKINPQEKNYKLVSLAIPEGATKVRDCMTTYSQWDRKFGILNSNQTTIPQINDNLGYMPGIIVPYFSGGLSILPEIRLILTSDKRVFLSESASGDKQYLSELERTLKEADFILSDEESLRNYQEELSSKTQVGYTELKQQKKVKKD